MDELIQAYKTMGLPENASKEEVDKRYTILMRQARSRQKLSTEANADNAPSVDFENVTRAYRLILDHENQQATEQFNQQEYGKYKKMAGTAAKVDHFWRYYKVHVFGGILAVALIIYGIVSFIDHREEQARLASLPPIDLYILYFGEYFINDGDGGNGTVEQLEEALLAQFPEWKRFKVNLTYVPVETKDQMDMASQQKAMIVMATEKPDIYIMDTTTFDRFAAQGVLLNLDDIATGSVKEALTTDAAHKQITEDDPTEHVYGIDISKSSINDNLPVIAKNNFIAGIRVNTVNSEKALQLINEFLEKS